ncbi:FMN-binding negative transcriptional regulator [Sorangium sp. So ce295]|uniref:FMN-binding negative transcriptional regulator n=1 Tax=Sorangium sp. So ce295 TaxID=3133295 RepID=UPI003F63A0A1
MTTTAAPRSIYLPRAFEAPDLADLHDLIDAHSFGMLIAPGEDGVPMIAHLPFLLERDSGPHGTLLAHVARANPIRRALDGSTPVLAVFRGSHGYISPRWYASRDDVPTWNYAVVHAHGAPRAIEDHDALLALLARLSDVNERGQPEPWSVAELSREKRSALLPAIVGFSMEITRIEAKLKLSQNRRPEDRDGAIAGLRAQGTPDDLALAEAMERARPR